MLTRYRLQYGRNKDLIYVSHLDLMRFWERAFRRARIPLAYSEGFTPHPRISPGAPLALGISSEAELLDVFLRSFIPPASLSQALKGQMPAGMELRYMRRLPVEAPSLQSQVIMAEYRVSVESELSAEEIKEAICSFLTKEEVPWQHMRDTGPRQYNLRPLVKELWLISCGKGRCELGMKLKADVTGSGRPEQVALALGFAKPPVSMHRTGLIVRSEEGEGGRQ